MFVGYARVSTSGLDLAAQRDGLHSLGVDPENVHVDQGITTAAPLERQYPNMYQPGIPLTVFPHSPGVRQRIFYGSGTHASAEQAAQDGVNLMSSTLVSETSGETLGEVQVEQIRRYRAAWKEAGHEWTPRVSVSRSIFPIVDHADRRMFGLHKTSTDQVGTFPEAGAAIFGRTYADEPDVLIEQLKADPAVMEADSLLIAIPTGMGVDVNTKILQNFAEHVAPALGWIPNTQGVLPVTRLTNSLYDRSA